MRFPEVMLAALDVERGALALFTGEAVDGGLPRCVNTVAVALFPAWWMDPPADILSQSLMTEHAMAGPQSFLCVGICYGYEWRATIAAFDGGPCTLEVFVYRGSQSFGALPGADRRFENVRDAECFAVHLAEQWVLERLHGAPCSVAAPRLF